MRIHYHKAITLVALATLAVASQLGPAIGAQDDHGPLHDQAKKAGGKWVWDYRPDRSVIYANIEELAKRSDVIVAGRTLSHRARLSADRSFVTRDFWIFVQEVIKGDLKAGTTVLASLPGGSYRFPDDVYVFVNPRGYKQAEDGRIYVLFLRNKGTNYKGHELSGGVQALFDITSERVQPADLAADDPVVVKYKDKPVAAFLAQIHSAVGRSKKPR